MRPKIGKKFKKASLNSTVTGFKKEQRTSTCSLLKNFETYRCCYVNVQVYPPTISRALHVI